MVGCRRHIGMTEKFWCIVFIFGILIIGGSTIGVSLIQNDQFDDQEYHVTGHHRARRRADESTRSMQIQQQLIPANYNSLEPPPTIDGKPSKVNLSIIVVNIRDIDEKQETITLEINLRMFWKDSRLGPIKNVTGNNSFLVLSPKLIHDIWHPDIFIDHSISVNQPALVTPPASLRIYLDNVVIRYSARLTVTVACEMNFHLYPVDAQECPVEMMSYAYPIKVMELTWADKGAYFAHEVHLANFNVHLDQTKRRTRNTHSADYSNLQFTIMLQRNISYYLIQNYLPSLIFLVISWVSFLLPEKNIGERVSCCMVTLLSLTVMFTALGDTSPKVSYFTGLHVWMITCVIIVFVSFVEFIAVLKLRSLSTAVQAEASKLTKKRMKRSSKFVINHAFEMHEVPPPHETTMTRRNSKVTLEENEEQDPPPINSNNGVLDKYGKMAVTLEKVTAIGLPCSFFIFNCVYWPWLIFGTPCP